MLAISIGVEGAIVEKHIFYRLILALNIYVR